jgi:hypothetical protein
MLRRKAPVHRRRLGGRKKHALRAGWWPLLFFALLCALAAGVGIMLEDELRKPVESVMSGTANSH